MAKKYFNQIFYRAAATPITTAKKGGTYPAHTFSGWTEVVGAVADKSKLGIEPDGDEPLGDGTNYTSGEKVPIEIIVKNFSAANYATLRAAMLNVKLDFMFFDADQPSVAYGAFGVRAYPKLDLVSGEEPTLTITGERKVGAGVTTAPFQTITVS